MKERMKKGEKLGNLLPIICVRIFFLKIKEKFWEFLLYLYIGFSLIFCILRNLSVSLFYYIY